MFRKFKVPVHYSFDADNDDTIMAHAVAFNGSVLSGDHDMFRYTYDGHRIKIYETFDYKKGRLVLLEHSNKTSSSSPRKVILPPPATRPRMRYWSQTNTYMRGSPSPLTRDLGNLHLIVRPLRQAIYHIQNQSPVKEIFPVWDEVKQCAMWDESQVNGDDKLLSLLKEEPMTILHYFFPNLDRPEAFSEAVWHNLLWAVQAIVFELITLVYPDKYTLFDIMLDNFKPPVHKAKVSLIK